MNKIITIILMAVLAAGAIATNSHALEIEPLGVEIHGFASQGFIQSSKNNEYPVSNANNGSFNFDEFGINFSKQITPDLRVAMQFFAQERGYYGHNDITLDYAYGDYRLKDWLGFRAGKIKMPLGLYNETRDADSLRTFIFLPQGIYTDGQRESVAALSGVSMYGTSPSTPLGTFAYQVQAGAISIANDSGVVESILHGGTFATAVPNTDLTTNYALEWHTPLEGLRLTGTYLHNSFSFDGTTASALGGPFTAGSAIALKVNSNDMYVASAEYTLHDLVLAAEYKWMNASGTTTITAPTGPQIKSYTPIANESYYLSATYRLNDLFEFGSYYDITHSDKYHPEASKAKYQKDAALAIKIDPVKNLTLKVEGHYMQGTELIDLGNKAANDKDWYMFASKVTYSF